MMSLQSTDFELFALQTRFEQDRALLDARWKELQRQAHPDKFADQGAAAQRVALQWSVRINEAYQRLKDPLKRAAYLCELHGAPVQAESNTAMPGVFLMQQMQWREELDDAQSVDALEQLRDQVMREQRNSYDALAQLIDVQQAWLAAVEQVRVLMFIERFARDLDQRLDQIET